MNTVPKQVVGNSSDVNDAGDQQVALNMALFALTDAMRWYLQSEVVLIPDLEGLPLDFAEASETITVYAIAINNMGKKVPCVIAATLPSSASWLDGGLKFDFTVHVQELIFRGVATRSDFLNYPKGKLPTAFSCKYQLL